MEYIGVHILDTPALRQGKRKLESSGDLPGLASYFLRDPDFVLSTCSRVF